MCLDADFLCKCSFKEPVSSPHCWLNEQQPLHLKVGDYEKAHRCHQLCVRMRICGMEASDSSTLICHSGVFYVGGIKVLCEVCWCVISSGLAAAAWKLESPPFGWRSFHRSAELDVVGKREEESKRKTLKDKDLMPIYECDYVLKSARCLLRDEHLFAQFFPTCRIQCKYATWCNRYSLLEAALQKCNKKSLQQMSRLSQSQSD